MKKRLSIDEINKIVKNKENKMRIKLHNSKFKDWIILEANTIEEIRKQGRKEMIARGWKAEDCWSKEMK